MPPRGWEGAGGCPRLVMERGLGSDLAYLEPLGLDLQVTIG